MTSEYRLADGRCVLAGEVRLSDLDDLEQLYERLRIPDGLVARLAAGSVRPVQVWFDANGGFIAHFRDYERAAIRDLMETTARLGRRKTRAGRYEKETLSGVAVRDRDTGDLIAAALHAVPPLGGGRDPDYRAAVGRFLDAGASGVGRMAYRSTVARHRVERMLLGGRVGTDLLVMRSARHAAACAKRSVIAAYRDRRPDVRAVKTYFLDGLTLLAQGESGRSATTYPIVNTASESFLQVKRAYDPFALEAVDVSDADGFEPPVVPFPAAGQGVALVAGWRHLLGRIRVVASRSDVEFRRHAAERAAAAAGP